MQERLVIGTRRSPLAMWQTKWVTEQLRVHWPGIEITLERIVTQGDRVTDVPLHAVGGKGLFTKEIEIALLDHTIDLAVHSMKDLPTELPEGLVIGAVPPREDPADAIVGVAAETDLVGGIRVGTSSLRRVAQLRARYPTIRVETIRGNIDTRLRKLDEGRYDAILLAAAGLKRLGLEERIGIHLPVTHFLPAVGQGALGIEIRAGDERVERLLAPLHDRNTASCVGSERALLAALGGGCQTPIGAYARLLPDGEIHLSGLVASPDGKRLIRGEARGKVPEEVGRRLATDLLDRGGRALLASIP